MAIIDLSGTALDIPNDWFCATAVFVAPPKSSGTGMPTVHTGTTFSTNVVLSREIVPPHTNASTVIDGQLRQLRAMGEDVQLRSRADRNNDHGQSGLMCELSRSAPGGERLKQLQWIVVDGDVAHILTATALDGIDFQNERPELERILLGAKFS